MKTQYRHHSLIAILFFSIVSRINAQNISLVPAVTTTKYLSSKAGGPTDTIQMIQVKIEYWLSSPVVAGAAPVNLNFQISNPSPGISTVNPTISMVSGLSIPASNFSNKHDTITIPVPIKMQTTSVVNNIEYFSIKLANDVNTAASHIVMLQASVKDPLPPAKDTSMKKEYMFLNAANFDFDGVTNVSYLGHINAFMPDLAGKWGINTGIMKINFSIDSTQTSGYQKSNVLIKPLDPIAVGTKYLKQFNKSEIITKLTMWSFYIQPFYKIKLSDKVDFLPLFHYEFQINKWTMDITRQNIQTDTLEMDAQTVKNVYETTNDFSTNSTLQLKSHYSWVSNNIGLGYIFLAKPWPGSRFFVQAVYGISIHDKKIQSARILPASFFRNSEKPDFFYLTRIYLQQELVGNLDAVVGLNAQRYRTDVSTNYAPYLGINIGLDGLKKLVNK